MENEQNFICPACKQPSAIGKKFCADCGLPLQPTDIKALVIEEVDKTLGAKFKEQKFFELEASLAILEKLKHWGGLFAFFTGIPLTIFLVCLAIFGFRTYDDFTSKIATAEQAVTPLLNKSIKQAQDAQVVSAAAQRTAGDAQQKASDASKSVSTIVEQTKAQLTNEMNARIQTLSRQVGQSAADANQKFVESNKTATQAQQSSSDVLVQVDQLKKQLAVASDTIAAQEKKITDTSELVKAIFSRGETDYYQYSEVPTSRLAVI